MTNLIRKLRGALGLGLKWAGMWMVAGVSIFGIIALFHPEDIGPGEGIGRVTWIFGVLGFLSGLGFAGFLALGERRRTLRELSLGRVALWGAVSAALIPTLMGANSNMAIVTAPLGALFATVSVAVARRGLWREADRSQITG